MATWSTEPARLNHTWTAFRQVPEGVAALYHSVGAANPDQPSGRWHRLGEGFAQYFSLEPAGAWAELVRQEGLRTPDRAATYTRDLYLTVVSESEIADLSTFDHYHDCGLDPRIAVGDHDAAQDLAVELRAAGYRGLLSPSAALPFATNLTVFGQRIERVLLRGAATWRNPDPDWWLPVSLVARGAAPDELLMETCFIGMPHEAYRKWLLDNGFPPPAGAP